MGARNSSVFATMAGQAIFSEQHLKIWAAQNDLQLGTLEFPFTHPRQFLKYYIDDVVAYSKQVLGKLMHIKIIEYLLFCVKTSNVKLARKKCNLFCEDFVYLGHQFSMSKNNTCVPDHKRLLFADYRSPRSKAECLSRLGTIRYYDSFFPLLNVIALPIQQMAHSKEPFFWDNSLEKAWQAIKLIASFNMTNNTIDPDKTLYLACDASQIAGA